MNIRLSKTQKIMLRNTEDVYAIMQRILLRENEIQRSQEHFWIIGLNPEGKILFLELLALGPDNRINIKAPQVFRMSIYKNAPQVILVHNHPSGIIEPSKADLISTDRLLKAGEIIEIEVIDHLIISEKEYFSFKTAGLIDQLKKSGAYEIVSTDKAELEKFRLEAEKEKGAKEATIKLAKWLLSLNTLPQDEIRKQTGLTIREMNKIIKEMQG
ncbi:MAG: JAB domain-containing protein [Bacteroidota bacterium]